mgnify:CR=1 FL=1
MLRIDIWRPDISKYLPIIEPKYNKSNHTTKITFPDNVIPTAACKGIIWWYLRAVCGWTHYIITTTSMDSHNSRRNPDKAAVLLDHDPWDPRHIAHYYITHSQSRIVINMQQPIYK